MQIEIALKPIWWDKQPQAKILFDNHVLHDGAIDKEINLKFDVADPIDDSTSCLDICLHSKTVDQTVVDGSTILKDQLLEIVSITIDEIDLGNLLWRGVYTPDYPDHMREQQSDLPPTLTTITHLGWNGQWRLQWSNPFYIWLLENLS